VPWRSRRSATILGAVTPVPDTLSEYQLPACARLAHRACKAVSARICRCGSSEIVPRRDSPGRRAVEGPFGDHTGYLQREGKFVFAVERVTMPPPRAGLPLDLHWKTPGRAGGARRRVERSVRAHSQKQFPKSRISTAAGGCSYRLAVVSIEKSSTRDMPSA